MGGVKALRGALVERAENSCGVTRSGDGFRTTDI
jgi:hypothetical protein